MDTENEDQPQGHPAWQELLEVLPESLHALVTPKLAEWDRKQQDQVQGLHSQYTPYKEFVDSEIDPEVLRQSLFIANSLQSDPEAFVKRVVENYNLETFKQQVQQQVKETEEEMTTEWDGDDISKHPAFVAMQQQFEQLNGTLTEQQQRQKEAEEEAKAQQEYEEYMEGLKSKYEDKGEFDELYVSALMANGLDGDAAVKQYYDTIAAAVAAATGQTQQQTQTPETPTVPVVMGGSGTAGSGTPSQQVKMGDLSKGAVEDLVIKMLEQSNQA